MHLRTTVQPWSRHCETLDRAPLRGLARQLRIQCQIRRPRIGSHQRFIFAFDG